MQPYSNQPEGLHVFSMVPLFTFEKANLKAIGNNPTVSDLVLSVSSHLSARVKIPIFSGLTQARSVETHKNALKADRHIKEMQVMKELRNFALFNEKQLIALDPKFHSFQSSEHLGNNKDFPYSLKGILMT